MFFHLLEEEENRRTERPGPAAVPQKITPYRSFRCAAAHPPPRQGFSSGPSERNWRDRSNKWIFSSFGEHCVEKRSKNHVCARPCGGLEIRKQCRILESKSLIDLKLFFFRKLCLLWSFAGRFFQLTMNQLSDHIKKRRVSADF